ncbi:MAG: carboxypeptidase-like regulatory domain-containing protein, partial [Bdellovibrionales bacterium]
MKTQSNITRLVVVGFYLLLSLSGCGDDEGDKPKKFADEKPNQQEITPNHLRLLAPDGSPVVGAQYLIGSAQNTPFPGNFGVTNEKGEFSIPEAWVAPEMVTVDAPGYLRATYMALEPRARDIRMTKKFLASSELRGRTTGHSVRDRDNIIDYALVMGAMSRQDLLNFQIQKVMSPLNDKISVVGQEAEIPSNISLPRQTERKLFINVTLDKQPYRLLVSQTGPQRFFIARGRFPFNDVVDGIMDKKSIVDLINYFSITGGSLRDINIVPGINNLDVAVNELTFNQKRSYKAPKLSSNQTLIALAATENGGYLIPTDFKRVTSEQSVQLGIWPEQTQWLAQVVKNTSEFQMDAPGVDRLSARLSPFTDNPPRDYLPLVANPRALTQWKFQAPEVKNPGVTALTTYFVISDLSKSVMNGLERKNSSQVWEIFAPDWVRQVELPQWPWNQATANTRVEVSFVGIDSNESIPLGVEM